MPEATDHANREIERCQREIAAIERLIIAGHPDLAGLCLALSDWSAELGILEDEKRRRAEAQRRDGAELQAVQALTE